MPKPGNPPVETEFDVVFDPIEKSVSFQGSIGIEGSKGTGVKGQVAYTLKSDQTETTSIEGEVKGGKGYKLSVQRSYSENKISGAESEATSIELSRGLEIDGDLNFEVAAYVKGDYSKGQKPAALDPEMTIHDESIGLEVGIKARFIQFIGSLGIGMGAKGVKLDNEENETFLDNVQNTLKLGGMSSSGSPLGMSQDSYIKAYERLDNMRDNILLTAPKDQVDARPEDREPFWRNQLARIDVWDQSIRNLKVWEVHSIAESAQQDFLKGVTDGWTSHLTEDGRHALFEHPDGTKLYVDREHDRAVFLRKTGELEILSTDDPKTAFHSQVDFGTTNNVEFQITNFGVIVSGPNDEVVVSSPNFIYSQDKDNDFTITSMNQFGKVEVQSDNLANHLKPLETGMKTNPPVTSPDQTDHQVDMLASLSHQSAEKWRMDLTKIAVLKDAAAMSEDQQRDFNIRFGDENIANFNEDQQLQEVVAWAKENGLEINADAEERARAVCQSIAAPTV